LDFESIRIRPLSSITNLRLLAASLVVVEAQSQATIASASNLMGEEGEPGRTKKKRILLLF
jgi:hypothetical protein